MTRHRAAFWWLCAFAILTLVFTTGVLRLSALASILGEYPADVVNRAPNFDNVSEALIEKRIGLRFVGLETRFGAAPTKVGSIAGKLKLLKEMFAVAAGRYNT